MAIRTEDRASSATRARRRTRSTVGGYTSPLPGLPGDAAFVPIPGRARMTWLRRCDGAARIQWAAADRGGEDPSR